MSDAALAVLSDSTSPWQAEELEIAKQSKVPILSLIVGKDPKVPKVASESKSIKIEGMQDIAGVIDQIVALLSPLKE